MSATTRVMNRPARSLLALVCACAIAPGNVLANVQSAQASQTTQAPTSAAAPARIPADQIDSLVAPIALYPDPLLAQVMAASTYPLELVQLQQWLARNPGLKDKALVDAVSKQPWDPSIQAMAALPDVVKRLTEDIAWTTDLGNAFLAQEADVMNAVQRMRAKAEMKGTLKSTPQQKVETQVVENRQVIVIEQADPQVVYVPSYDPVVVYGAPIYPYPPIYYPPPGYYAAGAAISFGVGVAMGAAWGGGWGWNAGWGHNDININNNNNFNRNANINRGNINGGNRVNALNNRGNGTWQHNAQHRGGAPYRDQATANKFGGTARGDSLANRQAGARQQVSRQGGNLQGGNLQGRSGGAVGTTGRAAGAGNVGARAQSGQLGTGGARAQSGQLGGGADRVGSRDLSRSGAGNGAFGGSGGFSGSGARDASRRGSSSMSRPSGGGGGRSYGGGGGGRSFGGGGGGGGRSRGGGGGGRRR